MKNCVILCYLCEKGCMCKNFNHGIQYNFCGTQKNIIFAAIENYLMKESYKKYRLTSTADPTDEMLQAVMEGFANTVRESIAKAEAEKQRRLKAVRDVIKALKKTQKQ